VIDDDTGLVLLWLLSLGLLVLSLELFADIASVDSLTGAMVVGFSAFIFSFSSPVSLLLISLVNLFKSQFLLNILLLLLLSLLSLLLLLTILWPLLLLLFFKIILEFILLSSWFLFTLFSLLSINLLVVILSWLSSILLWLDDTRNVLFGLRLRRFLLFIFKSTDDSSFDVTVLVGDATIVPSCVIVLLCWDVGFIILLKLLDAGNGKIDDGKELIDVDSKLVEIGVNKPAVVVAFIKWLLSNAAVANAIAADDDDDADCGEGDGDGRNSFNFVIDGLRLRLLLFGLWFGTDGGLGAGDSKNYKKLIKINLRFKY